MKQKSFWALTLALLLLALPLAGCSACQAQEDLSSDISDLGSSINSALEESADSLDDAASDKDLQEYWDDENTSDSTDNSTPSSGSSQAAMSTDLDQIGTLSSKAQGWGPGKTMDENNRPVEAERFQEKYGKYNADFIGSETEKTVYLTCDEGYENGYTGQILDVLKEKQVTAVFFITMHYAKSNPDLVQRMVDEGHIIGNHSTKHPNFTEISLERAQTELQELQDYMKETYNYDMTLFRFPEGAFTEQMLCLVQSMGYRSVFWSYDYQDWDANKQIGADKACEKLVDALHPGAIYLLHAVSQDNANCLGDVIDIIRSKGYTISPYNLGNS